MALTLDLPRDYFDSYFEPPMVMLRPLHYAAQVSNPGEGVFGAGAHSDYGMLTVLATDEVGGERACREQGVDGGGKGHSIRLWRGCVRGGSTQ